MGRPLNNYTSSIIRILSKIIIVLIVTAYSISTGICIQQLVSQCFTALKPRLMLPPTECRSLHDSFPIETRFTKIQNDLVDLPQHTAFLLFFPSLFPLTYPQHIHNLFKYRKRCTLHSQLPHKTKNSGSAAVLKATKPATICPKARVFYKIFNLYLKVFMY